MEDLKGMKLRVSNDPVMNGMVQGLGASPTVISFGELYSALQREFPKDTEVLVALAIVCRANSLTEQAKSFINKVIELEPWNADARDFLANL